MTVCCGSGKLAKFLNYCYCQEKRANDNDNDWESNDLVMNMISLCTTCMIGTAASTQDFAEYHNDIIL